MQPMQIEANSFYRKRSDKRFSISKRVSILNQEPSTGLSMRFRYANMSTILSKQDNSRSLPRFALKLNSVNPSSPSVLVISISLPDISLSKYFSMLRSSRNSHNFSNTSLTVRSGLMRVLCTCPMGKYIVNIRPPLEFSSLPDIGSVFVRELGKNNEEEKNNDQPLSSQFVREFK